MREDWSMETTVLLISLAIIPVLLALLLLCLKIKTSKSNPDLFGTVGTVTSKDDGDAYLPTSLNVSAESGGGEVRTPSYDRKLPELPSEDAQFNTKGKEGDSNSDLYATVDEMPTNNNCMVVGMGPAISLVPDSSHHPYAQVKKKRRQEHPYASVGGGTSQEGGEEEEEEEDTEEYDTAEHLLESSRPPLTTTNGQRSSGRGRGQWVPPPRRPEEQGRGRGASRQTTPLPPEPPPEIHFSGDSQDSFSAKGYTSISVREPLANLARPPQPVEGNYVTLSETSDEMYAAIEDTVYTHPGGAAGEESSDMYSKVDKAKKRGKSAGVEEKPAYATVSKPTLGGGEGRFNPGGPSGDLGARPKQRSPCPPSGEAVDYSEYEVSHTDSREPRFYGQSRDPGYETVPYSDLGQDKDPGYEVMPQMRSSMGGRDPGYETLATEARDPGYESVTQRERVNSIDPGYETVPQKRREPGYASLLDTRRPDPGYETVIGREEKRRIGSYGPRSFPPDDYESVNPKEPGYETLEEGRREDYRSLEPGYEELPDVRGSGMEVQYSRVNKKGGRAAPKHPSPPRDHHYTGSEVNYETLPEPQARGGLSDEGGYETIPANEQDGRLWDPGYETLPAGNSNRNPPSEPGYETIPAVRGDNDAASEAATTDPDYARLKDADIEYIDESADEVDDEIGRLQADEDVTVESSQSSSLIHMSVVESGHGVRRSSVVVIEHVDMTPVPSRASEGGSDPDMDVNTHIFV